MGSAQTQGQLWGRHPVRWSSTLEQAMRPLYAATFDALEPLAGRRVLDAGCGSGQAVQDAAARGAEVTGLDASAELLDIARTRTPEADLRQGELEQLPFPDDSFDVVTAFNAIQYALDPTRAVAELVRVCRPGGRVAIGMWGEPERCETDSLFQRLRSLAPLPPGTPAPLTLSDRGVAEDLLSRAGAVLEGGGEVPIRFTFTDLESAWSAHTSSGVVQRVIDVAGEAAVRAVIHSVLEADRKPDGTLAQDNVMRFILAGKRDAATLSPVAAVHDAADLGGQR